MSLLLRWIGIFIVLILQLTGLYFFGLGFFPQKIVLPGQATFLPDNDPSNVPDAAYNKFIFMVIDAFRSDFAFSTSSSMPFIHQCIRDRKALGYTAFSTPPTVTLPRLKGLTSGGTPNFLDAILNIADEDTSEQSNKHDSWVRQLKSQGKKIHMFGDDTWMKLFPDLFDKVDGTASFFVSDFTEVDNNVTRHLDYELSHQEEWDTLILHYLGLDHIGHKGGPESPFMAGKQKEMNGIIERIYKEMSDDTLLLVVGDHGMNEAGNHGGSSSGETSAATIFFSKRPNLLLSQDSENPQAPLPLSNDFHYYRKISQSDIVPTLAALLKFPIPMNSLGIVLKDVVKAMWENKEDQHKVLKQNVYQMNNIIDSSYPGFTTLDADSTMFCESQIDFDDLPEIEKLKCMWWKLQQEDNKELDEELAYSYLKSVQSMLSQASSNYNVNEMVTGLGFSVLSLLISAGCSWKLLRSVPLIRFILFMITLLYTFSMFGSSLVEEEHHLWYWGITGWVSWLYILTTRKSFSDGFDWVLSLIMVRIIRSWNQTGQKYAGGPDIASYLARPESAGMLWFLIMLYYGSLFERLWKGTFQSVNQMAGFVFSFLTIASSIAFKVTMACQSGETVPNLLQKLVAYEQMENANSDMSTLITLARLSFFIIAMGTLYELSNIVLADPQLMFLDQSGSTNGKGKSNKNKHITNMCVFLELLLVMQSKTSNIPLFIFFNMLKVYLVKATNKSFVYRATNDLDQADDALKKERFGVRVIAILSITILILQHMSFFAMGNSNSLASLDLSNAYNGVSSYNIILVGILTFIGNFAGPLYWSATGLSILLEDDIRSEILRAHLLRSSEQLKEIMTQRTKEEKRGEVMVINRRKFEESVSMIGQNVVTLRIVISQVFFSGVLVGILGACIALKDHLFIWTVFSPKLLYSIAWVILQHVTVDVIICTVLSFLRG